MIIRAWTGFTVMSVGWLIRRWIRSMVQSRKLSEQRLSDRLKKAVSKCLKYSEDEWKRIVKSIKADNTKLRDKARNTVYYKIRRDKYRKYYNLKYKKDPAFRLRQIEYARKYNAKVKQKKEMMKMGGLEQEFERKVNDTGIIPIPRKGLYGDREVYFKKVNKNHYFFKYSGFGMSQVILDKMEDLPIILRYEGTGKIGYLVTTVQQYKVSMISHDNHGDVQKIVRWKDMREITPQQFKDGYFPLKDNDTYPIANPDDTFMTSEEVKNSEYKQPQKRLDQW